MKHSGLKRLFLFYLLLSFCAAAISCDSSGGRSNNFNAIPPDWDGDGYLDCQDNCPQIPNPTQSDRDGDRIGDVCDACPENPFTPQTIYFEPLVKISTNPGPTDFMTVEDSTSPTGRRLNMQVEDFPPSVGGLAQFLLYAFNQLDGLSTTGDIVVYLSAPPNESTIRADTAMMININPSSPHFLEPAPLERWFEVRTDPDTGEEKYALVLRPSEPLYSRTDYLVIVTDGLNSPCGEKFESSPDMETLKSYTSISGPLAPFWNEYQQDFILAENTLGIMRENISLMFSYTTQSVPEDLIAIRETSLVEPPPVTITDVFPPLTPTGEINWAALDPHLPDIPDDIVISPGYFTNISLVVYGYFPSPSYINDEKVFQDDPETGAPIEFGTENLEFLLTLPYRSQMEPVPVIVFGHALGVCKETLLAISDTFARYGFATIGIDVPGHGSRSASGVECGKDSDIGIIFAPLINLNNILSIRDIFRQGVADEIHLVRMVKGLSSQNLDLMPMTGGVPTGDGALDLDTSRIGFCSQSLGSVLGGTLYAVEPDLNVAVLNVGGGYFSKFVAAFLGGGSTGGLLTPELLVGVQMVMDGADPLNYARAIFREPYPELTGNRPRNVLLQEAVDDTVVPNETTEILARAIGVDLVWPYVKSVAGLDIADAPVTGNISGSVTGGMYQFYPAEHQFLLLPDNLAATIAGQEQAAIFISTAFSNRSGAATILNTYYPSGPPSYQP